MLPNRRPSAKLYLVNSADRPWPTDPRRPTTSQAEHPAGIAGEEQFRRFIVQLELIEVGQALSRRDHRVVGTEEHVPTTVAPEILDQGAGYRRAV